jgi:hypothetical protein
MDYLTPEGCVATEKRFRDRHLQENEAQNAEQSQQGGQGNDKEVVGIVVGSG